MHELSRSPFRSYIKFIIVLLTFVTIISSEVRDRESINNRAVNRAIKTWKKGDQRIINGHHNLKREWCSGEPGSPCGPEPGVDDHTIGIKTPGKRSIRRDRFDHRRDSAYEDDYDDCISDIPGSCIDIGQHIKQLPCTPGKRSIVYRILGMQCDKNG